MLSHFPPLPHSLAIAAYLLGRATEMTLLQHEFLYAGGSALVYARFLITPDFPLPAPAPPLSFPPLFHRFVLYVKDFVPRCVRFISRVGSKKKAYNAFFTP